jgi:hypothetical protein
LVKEEKEEIYNNNKYPCSEIDENKEREDYKATLNSLERSNYERNHVVYCSKD